MAVLSISTWRIRPGKAQAFLETCARAKAIQERLGVQSVRLFNNVYSGANAGTATYVIEHENAEAQGAFTDKLNSDPEWQDFWQGVNTSDPSAEMIGNSIAVEVPVG